MKLLDCKQQTTLSQWILEGRTVHEFILKYDFVGFTEYKAVIGSFKIDKDLFERVVYEKTKKSGACPGYNKENWHPEECQ